MRGTRLFRQLTSRRLSSEMPVRGVMGVAYAALPVVQLAYVVSD